MTIVHSFFFKPQLNLFDILAVCGTAALWKAGVVGDLMSVILLCALLVVSSVSETHLE